jgi:hypothetical protein
VRSAPWAAGGGLEDVGAEPGKAGVTHALLENRGAEVELVVAEDGRIEAEDIPGLDHLPPLEYRRQHRGGQRIARQDKKRLRRLAPQLAHERGNAGQTTAAPDGIELVDIVDEEKLDPDGRPFSTGRRGASGQSQERKEDRRRAEAQ